MAARHGSSDSSFPRIHPVVLNGILLAVVACAAWQFLHWGDPGDPFPDDDSPKSRPPELVRQDLFRSDATPLERNRAIEAWVELGGDAVPKLLEGLAAETPAVRRYTANALAKIGRPARAAVPALRQRLHDDDPDVCHAAIVALSSVDPRLEENIPALVEFLQSKDDGLANIATEVLVQTGVKCVPEVCQVLADADFPLRLHCVFVLMRIGDTDPQAVATLRGLLEDPNLDIRRDAFQTLAGWDALSLQEVLAGLRFEDDAVNTTIMWELPRFGAELETVVPQLMHLRSHPQVGLNTGWAGRIWELLALAGPAASPAAPDVQAVLQSEGGRAKDYAVQCLARIATKDDDVVPVLREQIFGENSWMAERAGSALRNYDPEIARSFVPELIQRLREGNMAAVSALEGIGPAAADAVPPLVEALAEPDSLIARKAIVALGGIGPAARPAVPRLIELLDYEFVEGRNLALVLTALGHIGPEAEEAVPKLMAMIKEARTVEFKGLPGREHDYSARAYIARDAVRALGHMGRAARPAVPLLLELIHERPVSYKALGALERIAAADPDQRPAAVAAAHTVLETAPRIVDTVYWGTNSRIQAVAVRTLGRFGEPTSKNVSALARALENPWPTVRAMAAMALGHMGPPAGPAVPALRKALDVPVNALSHDWMPTALLASPETTSFSRYSSQLSPDALDYPIDRRSVRFAVLKALNQIESPVHGGKANQPVE